MVTKLPSAAYLKARFKYDKASGQLFWRPRILDIKGWNARFSGKPAGTTRRDGYIILEINGKKVFAHRVIWKIAHGADPSRFLDHVNRNPSDNRLCNLREATPYQNGQNKKSTSPFKGVTFYPSTGRYNARIYINGKCRSLGYFPSPEEAHAAYQEAARLHFGEFARFA